MIEISDELKKRLKNADKILFFTGAGTSAESGIPTFRGKDGLWKKFSPEELASYDAFVKNPDLVWEWYQFRRETIRKAEPNNAHKAIAEFEKIYSDVTVVTQNIDNLHRRAGSSNILELHGNIEKNYCVNCGKRFDYVEFENANEVLKCDACGGNVRPDVVWFGETLPQDVFKRAEQKAMASEICFVVGTSAIVYPAAIIPYKAKDYGAYIVEVNLQYTDFTPDADESFFGKAGEILPELLNLAKELHR